MVGGWGGGGWNHVCSTGRPVRLNQLDAQLGKARHPKLRPMTSLGVPMAMHESACLHTRRTGRGADRTAPPPRRGGDKTWHRLHRASAWFAPQVDAAVEAATESKLARIMAVDSTKDGYVPRRVGRGGEEGEGRG